MSYHEQKIPKGTRASPIEYVLQTQVPLSPEGEGGLSQVIWVLFCYISLVVYRRHSACQFDTCTSCHRIHAVSSGTCKSSGMLNIDKEHLAKSIQSSADIYSPLLCVTSSVRQLKKPLGDGQNRVLSYFASVEYTFDIQRPSLSLTTAPCIMLARMV